MAFKVQKINETSTSVEVGETLWLDADGKVVKDGDPSAARLLSTAGKRLSLEEAERYGLVSKSKSKAPAEDKVAAPDEDKQDEPELAKDLIARMSDMSDDELSALEADERKTVQAALASERERRQG